MSVGKSIKNLRELRNLTQNYMASQLEMTQAGYSKIERNEIDITLSKLSKIADILQVKTAAILEFDSNKLLGNQLNNYNNITNGFVVSNEEYVKEIKNIYEQRIQDLKTEIDYLRDVNANLLGK